MKESNIQSSILTYLKSIGCYTVNVMKASKAGVPDILCNYKGHFIAIEVKTPTTRFDTSELQKYNLECISKSGGVGFVACSLQEVKDRLALL